jgi:hypothetical protein
MSTSPVSFLAARRRHGALLIALAVVLAGATPA